MYCNNCGKPGHISKDCNQPITSYGVLLFVLEEEPKINVKKYMIYKALNTKVKDSPTDECTDNFIPLNLKIEEDAINEILNKKTNPKIPTAIEKPFFLKKLIIGPPKVLVIQAVKLVMIFFDPSLFSINLSVSFCFNCLSIEIGS